MAALEYIINVKGLLVIIAAWFGIQLVASYVSYRRLAHIPGPWAARWSSFWLVKAVWSQESHLKFYKVAKTYGEYQIYTPSV
jgi:hypothetical protein